MSIQERAPTFHRLHAPGQLLVLMPLVQGHYDGLFSEPVGYAEMNALFPMPGR